MLCASWSVHLCARACVCMYVYGVYKYFDSRKTFITDRYNILIYTRVNWICHMLQPIIKNVNTQQTKTFLLWHWACFQAATQRNAMQCNQSINQSIWRKKWDWRFSVGLIVAADLNVCQIDSFKMRLACMTHCARSWRTNRSTYVKRKKTCGTSCRAI